MPYIRCGGFVIGVAYQPLSRSSELRASPALASSVVVRLLFFSCRNTNIIDICFPIFTQLHDTKSEMIFFFWCDNELMFDTLRWKKKRRNRLDRFYNKKLCRSICQRVGNVMKKEVKLESLPAISYHSQWRNMQSSPNTLSTSSLMVFVKKKKHCGTDDNDEEGQRRETSLISSCMQIDFLKETRSLKDRRGSSRTFPWIRIDGFRETNAFGFVLNSS